MWELIYKVKRRHRTRVILKKETKKGYAIIQDIYYLKEERKMYKGIKQTKEVKEIIQKMENLIIHACYTYLEMIEGENNVI